MPKEYVVNAPPTRAVPLDEYLKGYQGPPLPYGYTVEAVSAKSALAIIKDYRAGIQYATDLANAGRINIFGKE